MQDKIIERYFEIQDQNPNAFVLIMMSDFYEIWGRAAGWAAELLGLTTTTKWELEGGQGLVVVGFPIKGSEQYIEKLKEHGRVRYFDGAPTSTEYAPNHSERAHALLSASSAHRWLACPPSAVAAELYPDQDTEFTREGTLAHEVAEIFARFDLYDAEPDFSNLDATQEMKDCATAYLEYIHEQIRMAGAQVLLEQRVDFSPWVPDGFGTSDCIIVQGDTMDVIDYKYGVGVAVSAKDNPQMKLYGLGALNDIGFAYDIKKVRLHIFQPRINNISVDELTTEELLEWAEKTVKPIAQKAAKGKGTYKAGEHCKFCPHAGRCRALAKVCTEYVETHGMRVSVPVLAPHEVAEALKMEPLISLWLKRVKDQAMTTLLNGDEVPGFKVVEGKAGNRKWTNEIKVADLLTDAGYKLEEFTETKLLSPAAMDKYLGKKKAAELLADYIDRAQGAPVIAPENDKRPAFNRLAEAQKDFE